MADEIAGQVVVQILGEASLKQIKGEVKKAVEAAGPIVVPVELTLAPKTVTNLVADAKKKLAAVRYKPNLEAGLTLKGTAVNDLVAEARLKFADRVDLPRLPASLKLADKSVATLITEANTKLAAAKKGLPKIKVDLDLDTEQMELVKELRAKVKAINVAFTGEVVVPLDLDEKSIARVSEKAAAATAVIQARIDAQMENREALREMRMDELRDADLVKHEAYLRDRDNLLADAATKEDNRLKLRAKNMQGILDEDLGKVQNRLNEAASRGLDARSMAELRFNQRRALMHERAEQSIRRSSATSLRILRNDLSSFDIATTRVLRRLGLVFAGFTAAITASFAAIGVAALRSFADTEVQLRRTAAVLGGGVYSQILAETDSVAKAQAAYTAEVQNTERALRGVVEQTALATVFDPTEIARGTRALAQAGLKVNEIQGSLKGVAQFAQNEELLPEEAVSSLVQGATAAGESLANLTQLGDKFTFVANDTTSSAKELADAFANRSAPAFRAYGESVSATLTVLDLFARAGIKGKSAGEQVGILIREINKAATKTPATTAAFKKYGIEIGKVNGRQIPFLETLADLGIKLDEVRREQGSGGLAKFRKELGLTEKSGAGLLQILPQVSQLGEKGILDLQKRIEQSGGALQRQSDIITNTLSFQSDRLANQISLLFKVAAGPTGKALTQIFKTFGDQMEAGEGAAGRLSRRIGEIGVAIRNEIVPAIESFFFGGQGADFFGGVASMYKGFLLGLRDSFVAFRKAAFGNDDSRGFFTVLGQSLANLGDFAASALPRIGNALGVITKFVNENEASVRLFIKTWLGAFVASKALRLLLVPLSAAVENIGKLRGIIVSLITLNFVSTITGWATAFGSYTKAVVTATTATRGLAAAQAATAGAQAAFGAAGPRRGAGSKLDDAALGALALQSNQRILPGISRLNAALLSLRANLTFVARAGGLVGAAILAAIGLAVGAVKGFVDRWRELTRGKDAENFKVGVDALQASLRALGRLFGWVTSIIEDEGRKWGAIFANSLFAIVSAAGATVRAVKFALQQIVDAFWASIRGIGDAIAWMIDKLLSIINALNRVRGAGRLVNGLRDDLLEVKTAVDSWGEATDKASTTVVTSIRKIPKFLFDIRTQTWRVNQQWRIAQRQAETFGSSVKSSVSGAADAIAARFPGATNAVKSLTRALREAQAERAADIAAAAVITPQMQDRIASGTLTQDAQVALLERMGNAAAEARLKTLGLIEPVRRAGKTASEAAKKVGGSGVDTLAGAASDVAASVTEVKTAAEQATEAVNKLTQAQLNRQAVAVVGRVARGAASGYKATAVEAEILKRVLPGVEAQLQRQQAAVTKLDEALQALQGTQLKGTKAFSDQTFAIEQSVKGLQLQRLDLVIAGTPEEDAAIKALDAQIASLQQQSERLSLVESLQLDPLKRKLEETFTPVKELGFDEIIKQFDSIQKQKAPLADAIAGGENLKAALETTIKDAEARFGEAGKQVTTGFANGIKATTPQVTAAGKASGQAALSGVNQVMAFGSPSRTMIQRGQWVTQGFVVGINGGNAAVQQAGVTSMFSFLTGMRNVYENRVKPFVISIAEWIKENKGPVAYDATLLRPAGEAMMYGFKRGLTDGFGEIQSWVRQVGPQLANDTFPQDMFFKRSASFLINNARMDKDFNADDAFGDMVFDALGLIGGDVPQSLAFLHKTLSSADTLDMAQKLAKMFGTPISSFLRAPGTLTTSGNVSDHTFGTAVDFSNGTRPTPQMDALHAAIEPLLGKVFKQILYRTMIGGNHFNHVHAAWLKGEGFSMNSGKKGGLSFPGASDIVNAAMAEASSKTGVNPMLIAAIAKAESGFNSRATSPAGAQGLMQLMPATARGLGVTNSFDPFQNALGGSKYIKGLLEKYGSIRLALAGYNAGPGNVAKYNGVPPFSETIAYIERVMRYFKNFSTGNFRAQGGKVNALTPYVVGERGQEMFIPSTNGSIVSNRDLRGLISALQNQPAGNSGSTVYDQRQNHIYSNSNDPATIAALVDSRMRSQIVGVRR
jgi:TP901 family phage tail tape measure protein